ncbi:MAG: hypothetical protein ACK6CU_30780 [Deltaproteobacteria bacterium]|jgi:hypothetical protein
MRSKLVVGVLLALAVGGCGSSNVVLDDAASPPDAGPGPDAFARDAFVAVPDAFARDAFALDAFALDAPMDAGPRSDSALDAGPTPPSILYVVAAYDVPSMPRGPRGDIAPGLNLDGRISSGGGADTCEDFASDLVSPTGEAGIDNELVGSLNGLISGFIAGYDLQAALDEDVASGRRLLAIRLDDLDSFIDDDDVRVDLLLVRPEGCASGVCPPPGGVVSPGARWSRVEVPLATALPGAIVGGRLRVLVADLPLTFDAAGVSATMTIEGVLEADVSAAGLDEGVIAGGIAIDELVDVFETVMPGIGETARGVLEGISDLKPSPDPWVCEQVSAGMGITAVPGTME